MLTMLMIDDVIIQRPLSGLIPRNHLKAAEMRFDDRRKGSRRVGLFQHICSEHKSDREVSLSCTKCSELPFEVRGDRFVKVVPLSSASSTSSSKPGSNKRPFSGSPSANGTYKGTSQMGGGSAAAALSPASKRARNESYSDGVRAPAFNFEAAAAAEASSAAAARRAASANAMHKVSKSKTPTVFVSWVSRCLSVVQILKSRKCSEYFRDAPQLQGYNEVVPKEDARYVESTARIDLFNIYSRDRCEFPPTLRPHHTYATTRAHTHTHAAPSKRQPAAFPQC